MIDPIHTPTAHAHDPAVAHADVEGATVRAQHAGRLNPVVDRTFCVLVYANRPLLATLIRSANAPGFRDPIHHR